MVVKLRSKRLKIFDYFISLLNIVSGLVGITEKNKIYKTDFTDCISVDVKFWMKGVLPLTWMMHWDAVLFDFILKGNS